MTKTNVVKKIPATPLSSHNPPHLPHPSQGSKPLADRVNHGLTVIVTPAAQGADIAEGLDRVKLLIAELKEPIQQAVEARQKIVNQIKGLLAKTVENGCTEPESAGAAEAAEKFKQEHGISGCEIETGEADATAITVSVDLGPGLLEALEAVIKCYVVLPDYAALTIALWVLHAHTHDAFDISPFLTFTSPLKRCGKTTALAVLYQLVPRPESSSNITPAAVYRLIGTARPTLLLDEAETYITKANHHLRGILNASHNRAQAYVTRTEKRGGDFVAVRYSVWAPKVVALIGELPTTLQDRSIVIRMRRKGKGDRTERFSLGEVNHLQELMNIASLWGACSAERLMQRNPNMPAELNDRAADNWRPLLTIADLIGGDIPLRARRAAVTLEGGKAIDSAEEGERLLTDCKLVFEQLKDKEPSAKELIKALATLPESEWQGLTERAFALLLKPFSIKARRSGPRKDKMRWNRLDFENSWASYCP
jgi:putative DNA primase/helicase